MGELHHLDCSVTPCTCGGSWPGGKPATGLLANERAALTWLVLDEENDGVGYVDPGHRLRRYFDSLVARGLARLLPGCKDSFIATDAGRALVEQ